MAPVLRRALLASSLLALRALAFVPGGTVGGHHVRIPSVVGHGLDGPARARARPAAQGRARAPAMMEFHTVPLIPAEELLQLTMESVQKQAAAPAQVPVDAVTVLGEWEREADSVAAKSTASKKADRIAQFVRGAQTVYGDLGMQCIRGTPELVFGLTKRGTDSIIAMANVNTLEFDDPSFGKVKSAVIGYLAVAPTADLDDEVAARLYLEIKKWADEQGRYTVLTADTEEATEYYASVGMDTISPQQGGGLTIIYPKLIPLGRTYQSVTLGF